ncbi:surface lipoprotein assembly modifier [Gemmobacter sp.]|uniref:surface lipoprotein assembly modifier n=1 Tax=Gemmobacter sp. TaxID=1898957 RepID=UPI002AFE803D|nr:surface lipoprotein assembly modifier [Gemmobacter sp.]
MLRRLGLAAAACAVLAGGAMAQTVTITPDEARAGLRQALALRQYAVADQLAQAILRRLPDDFAAHAARAEVALQQGNGGQARDSARQASALARSPGERFEASILRARVAEQAGGALGPMTAMFWTRRAAQQAPHVAYRSAAVGELRRLRAESRLQLNLGITLTPSSNVNNGTRETHVELPGWGGLAWVLSPQSRALSGWIAEGSVSGRYRLAETDVSARYLRFAVVQRKVRLSGESRQQLADWRAAQIAAGNTPPADPNYDFAAVEAGVQQMMLLGKAQVGLGATVGHNWFGGRDLSDYLRLDAQAERALSPDLALFGTLLGERQWRDGGTGVDTLSVQAGVVQRLARGGKLRLALGARRTAAASVDTRHDALSARMGWEPAAPVAGLRLETSVGVERRSYDASLLAPTGRSDLRLDAGVSVTFQALDYMGFAPTVDLRASRYRSNVKLYDGRDLGISLGFRSVF